MILRRVIEHFKKQEWTAIALDFVIVVMGVFIGIQLGNWNEARTDRLRKDQIIEALIADLEDGSRVAKQFVGETDAGLTDWEVRHQAGDRPAPFIFRMGGSYSPPDTWGMLQQMQLADLFDPVTLFDLTFYYSRSQGISERYVHYVRFAEDEIAPFLDHPAYFYADGPGPAMGPRYAANMDRLREIRDEWAEQARWADCLAYRLTVSRRFEQTCVRAGFHLPEMTGYETFP